MLFYLMQFLFINSAGSNLYKDQTPFKFWFILIGISMLYAFVREIFKLFKGYLKINLNVSELLTIKLN